MKAAAGTGGHEAQVIAYLGELHGKPLEGSRVAHISAGIRGCLHKVFGHFKVVSGELTHKGGAELCKAGNGVEAGADSSAAHVDFLQQDHVPLKVCKLFLEVGCKGVEFLAGSHGNCILKLRTAHLKDIGKFVTLGAEGIDEGLQGLHQIAVHAHESIAECGGIGVVGGLGAVHVVVGGAELVLTLLVAHKFQGTVCDYLIGVHVHGCAGAALHHIHGELVPELSAHNLLAGCYDCIGNLPVKHTQTGVCLGCSHLHVCNCNDVLRIVAHVRIGDLVIVDGALCLDTVISVNGNLEFTDKVTFDPEKFFGHISLWIWKFSIQVCGGRCCPGAPP